MKFLIVTFWIYMTSLKYFIKGEKAILEQKWEWPQTNLSVFWGAITILKYSFYWTHSCHSYPDNSHPLCVPATSLKLLIKNNTTIVNVLLNATPFSLVPHNQSYFSRKPQQIQEIQTGTIIADHYQGVQELSPLFTSICSLDFILRYMQPCSSWGHDIKAGYWHGTGNNVGLWYRRPEQIQESRSCQLLNPHNAVCNTDEYECYVVLESFPTSLSALCTITLSLI